MSSFIILHQMEIDSEAFLYSKSAVEVNSVIFSILSDATVAKNISATVHRFLKQNLAVLIVPEKINRIVLPNSLSVKL